MVAQVHMYIINACGLVPGDEVRRAEGVGVDEQGVPASSPGRSFMAATGRPIDCLP